MKKLVYNLYDIKSKSQGNEPVSASSCRGWSKNEFWQVVNSSACRGWSKNEQTQVVRCRSAKKERKIA